MKAEIFLDSVGKRITAIISLVAIAFLSIPEATLASNNLVNQAETEALVFEVKPNQNLNELKPNLLTYQEIVEKDPLVVKLRNYLIAHKSPLYVYASEIVQEPQWPRALAISWQESNFGIHCFGNNCSGIGGAPDRPTWRSYETKLDWFRDMSKLMERPIYKKRFTNCKTMNGVYNAGSQNWVRSCEKKSAELLALVREAEIERQVLISEYNSSKYAIRTDLVAEK